MTIQRYNVEDYVDTYLNQLREKAKEQPVGVILAGEVLELEDEKGCICVRSCTDARIIGKGW